MIYTGNHKLKPAYIASVVYEINFYVIDGCAK